MATTSCGLSRRHALLLATTVLVSGLAAPALAQSAGSILPPPVRETVDENGVNLITGRSVMKKTEVSIGSAEGGLAYVTRADNGFWNDSETGTIDAAGASVSVTVDGVSDGFTYTGGLYVSSEGNGATLIQSGAWYTYTSRYGVVATFIDNSGQIYGMKRASMARLSSIARPNGSTENYFYETQRYCGSGYEDGSCPSGVKDAWRLKTVTNSNGYRLTFAYAYNGTDVDSLNLREWAAITSVTASNLAISGSGSTAVATFSTTYDASNNATRTATDPLGRTTTFYKAAGGYSGQMKIKRPGASTPNITINYDPSFYYVASIIREGLTYNYSYAYSGMAVTTTVTAPDSSTRVYVGDLATNRIASYRDELNRLTSYTYDANGRVSEITMPEGNKFQYTYDGRGNTTQTRAISKTPGTPADIVTTVAYPSSCSNVVTCNKPTSATDARGNTTDYTYDATHGGVLTVTAPAPTSGAVRPQTRYGYAVRNAYYSLVGGSPVAGPNTYMPISISVCRTTASCSGGADEVKTTIDYGPQVAGTPNNLLSVGTTTGAGDGSLTATVTATYDAIGNRTYIDGPLTGAADTTRTLYDAARQPVGVIGPDPDGAGALLNRATRVTYNSDGQTTLTEQGTTTGQSDGNWAAFAPLQAVASAYDTSARKVTDKVQAGGTVYALSQYSYDTRGRPECTATRMNTATFGSLPSSACTLGTAGSFADDRIGKTVYDAARQVTKTQMAVGTADVADEVKYNYSANGRPLWLADANENYTSYVYDGFDRVHSVIMPSPTSPGNGNPNDYTEYTYDANSNVTSRRLRDGQSFPYTYDNLNRVTLINLPLSGIDGPTTYAYDLLGRLTNTVDYYSHNATFTYDALGRVVSEGSIYGGTKASQYDLAGRRTRLTWADGFYVDYDHLVTGEVSAIRENGATSGVGVLGTYSYDNLGRRTTLVRGNATQTDYAYDSVSRLSSMTNNLGATAHDVTTTFTYNPAGQIANSTRSNDVYAYPSFANKDAAETPNGLNQLTLQASTTLGYDGRGNVASVGSTGYSYTLRNQQYAISGGYYYYDPLGRLDYISLNSVTGAAQLMDYDGDRLTTERSSSGITRRYVHGPSADEVLVWYEGSGTSDRRWLYQDERGSVTAMANASGNAIALNSYDDYGTPLPPTSGGSAIPARHGCPNSVCGTTRLASMPPPLGGSCRPTLSTIMEE